MRVEHGLASYDDSISSGWGSNWDTVTGLLKVTAIFRNCIVTGLHFQIKECIGTLGYLMAGKVTLLTLSDKNFTVPLPQSKLVPS